VNSRRKGLTASEIQAFWMSQVERHGPHPASSWSDWRVIELEIATIAPFLTPGLDVLDAGCGTGYASARYAAEAEARVVGIDYVPQMIETASTRRAELPAVVRERLDFRVGDVRRLDLPSESFDRVVSTRVVINLPTRVEQRAALREYARVLRPDGLLLLSEASVQGWERLNALRDEWGLPAIPMPEFNSYLDDTALFEDAGPDLDLEQVENFASSYYVATRLLKPLLARAVGGTKDVADPDAEFNRWAAALPAAGDYGTQKLFVLRKRI